MRQVVCLSCRRSCERAAEGGERWAVRLAATPLYPEGGGQPADRGWLRAGGGAEGGRAMEVQPGTQTASLSPRLQAVTSRVHL